MLCFVKYVIIVDRICKGGCWMDQDEVSWLMVMIVDDCVC